MTTLERQAMVFMRKVFVRFAVVVQCSLDIAGDRVCMFVFEKLVHARD